MNRFRQHIRAATKLVLAATGSAALVMTLTVNASAQAPKEIAVMLPAAGDPYFKLKACGYTEAGKQAGYDVKIYDAGGYGNLSKQVSQIQDVIQRKVSGIVLVPASSDGTVPVVEQAIEAGIPVINDGIATHSSKVTGFVGEPSYVMTELLAAYVADRLGGKGEVAMLSGPGGLDLTKQRVDGFKDYLGKFPGIKVVVEKFTSTSSADALNTMQDFLQGHPNLTPSILSTGPLRSALFRHSGPQARPPVTWLS
jgi:ABC-type sugar transport system substrate-binding protein